MSPHTDRRRALRRRLPLLAPALLVALVTWLFFRAQGISAEAHSAYLQSLRRLQQADVALNAAVLAAHSGVLQNYDPLVRRLAEVRAGSEALLRLPEHLPELYRQPLLARLEELFASQRQKADDVDRFQRAQAVLRNSEFYLPALAEELDRDPLLRGEPAYRQLVRRLLAYRQAAEKPPGDQLLAGLAHLRRLQTATPQAATALNLQLRHGEVIVRRGPEVAQLVQRILDAPSGRRLDEVESLYVRGYRAAAYEAGIYRVALYAVSLFLAIYLIHALLRIERNRRLLGRAHRDLEARYEAQRRAEAELRLYGTVFTNAREGMTITDAAARIVAVNPAFARITGYAADDVLGKTPAILNSGRQGADFYQRMWQELVSRGEWHGEIWNRRKDGGIYPEWLSIVAVGNESGPATHYIGVFSDISERKFNEERIQHLAHHDGLTGLPNRVLLEDRIGQGMLKSKRSGRIMGLLFIDLDRFKNINDTLGHAIGDQLLIEAAARGLKVLRDSDTLARLGGDEFVAVLPELDSRQAAGQLARKLLAELCRPYQLAGHQLTVSASAGIALFPDDGHTVSDLLRKADAAMYWAKEEGRNGFRYFSAEISRASLGDLLLENDLHGALERGELMMYFEPKVDARSGQVVGAEALMRWRHRERGMIPPGQFIPLAEQMGLINLFGEWALRTVCAQIRAWLDAGFAAVPVAVNLAAQQFAQPDIPELLADILDEHRLPAELLVLELTESSLMRNTVRATAVLEKLRAMKLKVAIDDFGVGYSSLGYLKQFPVDALKIDRSFVCEIGEDGEEGKLAAAIIAMAHELDLLVVAEGVENECQRDHLRAHGCDQLQGYLFGRPQPADEFARLLAVR